MYILWNIFIILICICSVSELDTMILGHNILDSAWWFLTLLLLDDGNTIVKFKED